MFRLFGNLTHASNLKFWNSRKEHKLQFLNWEWRHNGYGMWRRAVCKQVVSRVKPLSLQLRRQTNESTEASHTTGSDPHTRRTVKPSNGRWTRYKMPVIPNNSVRLLNVYIYALFHHAPNNSRLLRRRKLRNYYGLSNGKIARRKWSWPNMKAR
jgi:hypothetical protein